MAKGERSEFDDLLGPDRSEKPAHESSDPPAVEDESDTAVLDTDADSRTGAEPETDTKTEDSGTGESTSRVQGWRRVFRGNRVLWLTALIGVVALVGGLLLGRFVLSPADAASLAEAPEPGLITVEVERGVLSNDVTIRGEIAYADSVEVTLEGGGEGASIVTGAVPEAGSNLEELSVALEVTGRPIIVLPGELPAYRTLTFGMTGPDVVQFKQAMREVGLDAGDPESDVFDATAANAVTALYAEVGYPAPASEEGAAEAVQLARDSVRAAEQEVETARAALDNVSSGVSAVDVLRADNAVNAASRALEAARAETPDDTLQIAALEDELAVAKLEREELNRAPDSSGEKAALEAAQGSLTSAQEDLTRAQQDALPSLPSGEVLYLAELPRRIDAVNVARGDALEGPALVVSGATLSMSGSAAPADAALLEVGAEASFALPEGGDGVAVVTALEAGASTEDRWTVTLEPKDLTPEQITNLQGTNVRVQIPVGATEGEVLYVPVAALTAGPGGEERVEVVDGDPRDGDEAETRLVVVETGLAAQGSVEVRPIEDPLDEGDLVVVGR